jgi:hypothetical protein
VAAFAFIRDLNPQLDDLPAILNIIRRNEGNNDAIANGIKKLFDKTKTRGGYSLHSIHANTMSSLREDNLGVMDVHGNLTSFGKELLKLAADEAKFKAAVAKHLITAKGGLAFCRALEVLGRTGKPTRKEIARFLVAKHKGNFWRDHNNLSSMHNFLEWAGVVTNYRLNEEQFKIVVGIDTATAKNAEELSPEANLILQALVRAGGKGSAGDLRRQAETLSGRHINPHSMPSYGKELEGVGFITLPGQRGSKTAQWELKPDLQAQIIGEVAKTLSETRPLPDEAFSRSFAELLKDAKTKNIDKKGRALEHLAARICFKLDLHHVEIRKLSDYEIDVRAEAHRPVFQKWVMQCKATTTPLGPAPVLREYGIAKLENIPVIVFVVTAAITARARSVANQIMRQSNKIVLMFDQLDLDALAKDDNAIYEILERQSGQARQIKIQQTEDEVITDLVGQAEEATAATAEAEDEEEIELERPTRRRRRFKRFEESD